MKIVEITVRVSFTDGEWVVLTRSPSGRHRPSQMDERSSLRATFSHFVAAGRELGVTEKEIEGWIPTGPSWYQEGYRREVTSEGIRETWTLAPQTEPEKGSDLDRIYQDCVCRTDGSGGADYDFDNQRLSFWRVNPSGKY